MEKQLIAHVRRDRSTGEVIATQSLKEHSSNAAELCSENCRVANLSKAGKVAGLQHDGGKSSKPGQIHLEEGTKERVNHSSAGMRYTWERCKEKSRLTGQLISLATTAAAMTICRWTAGSLGWRRCTQSRQKLFIQKASQPSFQNAVVRKK